MFFLSNIFSDFDCAHLYLLNACDLLISIQSTIANSMSKSYDIMKSKSENDPISEIEDTGMTLENLVDFP